MTQETVTMSTRELKRSDVMERLQRGELLLKEAAWLMKVSVRQAIRIRKRFLTGNAVGLVHRSRGMPSHHRAEPELKRRVLAVYADRYPGFGPTLAVQANLPLSSW